MNIQSAMYETVSDSKQSFNKNEFTHFGEADFANIKKAILRSQRCQRNWDLSKQLTTQQLDLILAAATECPTKQNIPFYCVKVVQDRAIIEAIYEETFGAAPIDESSGKKNPQVLANTLLIFCEYDYRSVISPRNPETAKPAEQTSAEHKSYLDNDFNQAIGIAAGFVNLTANLIGLQTGCCKCMDADKVKTIIGAKENEVPRLLMGVGFADPSKPRQEHHLTGEIVHSYNKKIKIDIIEPSAVTN